MFAPYRRKGDTVAASPISLTLNTATLGANSPPGLITRRHRGYVLTGVACIRRGFFDGKREAYRQLVRNR